MRPLQTDLSIYRKFNFEKPPVGIKFSIRKPEGMEQLDKTLHFCEMLKEAQHREAPFYFTKENEDCVGKIILGMEAMPLYVEAGELGPKYEVFQEPRANYKIYDDIPRFKPGLVRYVALAPLDKLTFEPDVLILTTTVSQAEIVLRAMSYSTGELWAPKTTSVLGCAWIYIYPFQSGKVNYTVTGLAFGMKALKLFEEGLMLISIPYNWIPTVTQNLLEMKWVLPSYAESREEYKRREKRYDEELLREFQDL
jgi:uncharacterized protein (DUF169 family)